VYRHESSSDGSGEPRRGRGREPARGRRLLPDARGSPESNRLRTPTQPPTRSDTGIWISAPRARDCDRQADLNTRWKRARAARQNPAAGPGGDRGPARAPARVVGTAMNAAGVRPSSRPSSNDLVSLPWKPERLHEADAGTGRSDSNVTRRARAILPVTTALKRRRWTSRPDRDRGAQSAFLRWIIGAVTGPRCHDARVAWRAEDGRHRKAHGAGAGEGEHQGRAGRAIRQDPREGPVSGGRDGAGDRAGDAGAGRRSGFRPAINGKKPSHLLACAARRAVAGNRRGGPHSGSAQIADLVAGRINTMVTRSARARRTRCSSPR